MPAIRLARTLALAAVLVAGGGCGSVAYLGQAAVGQIEILAARRPIDAVLADPATPTTLAERLRTVRALRRFAADALALPASGSFTHYAALGREYVVWNVFATPELSLAPRRWCYPLAGCFDYRGYFRERCARRLAERLARSGDDVYVGGVAAYSTLGWFADPVLDTMLRFDDVELARVVFHELAHERLYIAGDTSFNEAYATAVAEVGVERWAARRGAAYAETLATAVARDRSFVALVLETRERLAALYAGPLDAPAKRRGKARLLAELGRRYERWKAYWGGYDGYDAWMREDLNNAKLAAVASYHALVPHLRALLERGAGDLERFHAQVATLARLPAQARRTCLAAVAAGELPYDPQRALADQCPRGGDGTGPSRNDPERS